MTTPLEKTLKRELSVNGRAFVLAISPEGLKLTLKGKRNGLELGWADLVSGEAALATALHASLGRFADERGPPNRTPAKAAQAGAPAPTSTASAKRAIRGQDRALRKKAKGKQS